MPFLKKKYHRHFSTNRMKKRKQLQLARLARGKRKEHVPVNDGHENGVLESRVMQIGDHHDRSHEVITYSVLLSG